MITVREEHVISTQNTIKQVYRRRYESRHSSKPKLHEKQKIKYGEKRFSIWRMEFLHSGICGSGIVTVNSPSGSTLQCARWLCDDMPLNSPKRPPYWNSTSGFEFDHITAVDMSFCTSLRNLIQIGPPSAEKMTSCRSSRWLISAILDFRGPVMGSLKSPCTTSYRSSVETIPLNGLVFEKIAFFLHFGDRQTNRRTDGQHRLTKPLSLSRAAA